MRIQLLRTGTRLPKRARAIERHPGRVAPLLVPHRKPHPTRSAFFDIEVIEAGRCLVTRTIAEEWTFVRRGGDRIDFSRILAEGKRLIRDMRFGEFERIET